MNIAEITTYKEGGAYTHVVELVKKLDSNVLIVTGNTKKSGFEEEDGYLYYHVPTIKSLWEVFFVNRFSSYSNLEKIFEEKKIDIIHFHSPLFTFLNGFLVSRRYPLIMTTHYLLDIIGNDAQRTLYYSFIKRMTRYVGKRVDKIICVNEDYIPVFEKWGIKPEKMIYIPNGVDTNRFSPDISKFEKKFENKKIILYFGRLHYQKNVELLVRSVKYIKEKTKNVKLIIVGTGNQYDKLKRMTEKDKDILMTGFVSDEELVEYMRLADIVVFPSRGENASFTIMEAMACELPVVSSDVGNAKKILDEKRGILLEKYTEDEIADICIDLLTDEKKAKKIGKDARKYVEKHHNWDVISKKTEELYKKVLEDKKF